MASGQSDQLMPPVRSAGWPAWRRPRLFASQWREPRARRATDAIVLLGSAGGLLLLAAMAVPQPGIERALMVFVAKVPRGLHPLWQFLIVLIAVYSLVLLLATALRTRWAVLRDLVLAVALALVVSLVIGRIVAGAWPAAWDSLRSLGPSRYFPPLGLTLPATVVVTAAPHLTKPARRFGNWLILLALAAVVLKLTATSTGAVAGLLVATACAAALHLIFGSCMGRPSLADVADALAQLGIAAHSLGAARRQPAGVFVVDAFDDGDRPLVVKVYGRDAQDTQLATTVWRTLWYREAGSPLTFGRLQQAEHEALLTPGGAAHPAGRDG